MTEGLVRYDAMCQAIAECHRVDEVKELRDKARALEVYAKQAMNLEAERKAAEIRIRAERRTGELLREMKENGTRQKPGDNPRGINSRAGRPLTQLSDIGITKDQSSKWQQLAAVPLEEFEEAVRNVSGPYAASTEGIINAHVFKEMPKPRIDPDALWIWGRLCDFERNGVLERPLHELHQLMPAGPMRDDCARIAPKVTEWLLKGVEEIARWNQRLTN